MARVRIGTRVSVDDLRGVVVGHRPQGMVDVQPDDADFIIRKQESALRRLNPKKPKKTKKTVSRRSEVHRQHIEKAPKAGAQGSKKGKKGYQRKEKHKTRYNPERGSPALRVRREVEKMLHNPPSSWRALYKRAGLSARPSVDDFIDIVRSKTPSGRSAEAHYGREMGQGRHVPPKAVREAALHGLRLSYDNNYTSQSGVGLARAVQLVLDPSIDDLAKTRMRAYLTRHERDKQGKNFGNDKNPSNGYMAWLNWGGDPAKEWLNMRSNPIFGFGSKKKQKAARIDPKVSFQRAIDIYNKSNKQADEALVLALNKRGTGHAWYWLSARRGLGLRSFEAAPRSYIPQRYITDKDPTDAVIANLRNYRNAGNITYVTIDTFTGKMTGPFKGSDVLPAAANPAGRKPDVMEKQDEQFRAVVQGIYETLMAKRLRVKSIFTDTRQRRDVAAVRRGTLSKGEVRDILGSAHAIATRQGQKHGYLRPGSQKPTAKGRRRAYKRQGDKAKLAQNSQDYEITLALARKSSPLRIVVKGRGASRRFHVQPRTAGINPDGYKSESAAKAAITRLRRNPSHLEETLGRGRLGSDDDTLTDDSLNARIRERLTELAKWSKTASSVRLRNAHQFFGPLMNDLVEAERNRGLTPIQMRQAAAERLLAFAANVGGAKLDQAAEAIARSISPELFRRAPKMTPEERARVQRLERAEREGRRSRPATVGQSDVGGREFVAGVRRGKEEADRRKAGKAKGKVKAGIGRAGVGIGDLSRKGRAAEDTTFTAPPGQEGANYPTVAAKDADGNPITLSSNISYTIAKSSGNMTLYFGLGDEERFLPLGVPRDLENVIYTAGSVAEANAMMAQHGRSPLGLKQMYRDKAGRIAIDPLTPERLQQELNRSPERNFRRLAEDIVKHGYQKRAREDWDRPVVTFTEVNTFDDRGKPAKFETYVVYGFGGSPARAQAALNRVRTKRKQWRQWKEALGSYDPPIGVWDARASHKTVGGRGQWYIVGPLAYEGLSPADTKEYIKYLRRLARQPPEIQKEMLKAFAGVTRKFYPTKAQAEVARKRLDARHGRKQTRASDIVGATFAYYLDPAKADEDGGYAVAVAAADQLRTDAPVPPGGTVSVGRRAVLARTKRSGAARRAVSDSYEIVEEMLYEIGAQGMRAFRRAERAGDTEEIERMRGIAKRMKQVKRSLEKARSLPTGKEMNAELSRIYDQLERIEETI